MTPIKALISRHLKLVRKGRLWWGLCPFHPDKNPSLAVYEDHYHCFSCQAHGDAIEWLRRIEKLSFFEAKKRLDDGDYRSLPKRRVPAKPTEPAAWPTPGIRWQEEAFARERMVQSHWSSPFAMFIIAVSAPPLTDDELRLRHPHAQPYVIDRLRKIYPRK